MKNHTMIGSKFFSRTFFALTLVGLLAVHGKSQTITSQTSEKSETVNGNQSKNFTFSVEPTPTKDTVQRGAMCGGVLCLKEKINSLWLPIPWRIARLFQYEYKLSETPGTVQIGADFKETPQDYLHQHTLTLKFAELFPDRLTMFKRGSDYLKKNPGAAADGGLLTSRRSGRRGIR